MKKLLLLSGMMVFGIASINAAQKLTEEQRRKIEEVQRGKISQQKALARPAIYKMIDPLVEKRDWPAIFAMLDQMQGVIDVNEYRDGSWSLLYLAAFEDNFLAAKTLLEKYKANPNLKDHINTRLWDDGYSPFMFAIAASSSYGDLAMVKLFLQHGANPNYIVSDNKFSNGKTPFIIACESGDLALVKLLLQYKANPYLKAADGTDAFKAAKDHPEILNLLNKYNRPARAA
ncbi:MAG TPA: ankyrin repeat domain-containing protein [Candidatus Babeliales bacterium]|jgi:hypothetical protein|nr:ankyrin repeat domain-containing protein [Candidatus Babeliales bacterium]